MPSNHLKPIPSFPRYTVNRKGEVFKQGKAKIVSCKKARSAKVIIRVNKKIYTIGLATLVAELFIVNPRQHKHIIFKDRNHHNCCEENIAWVDAETHFYYCCHGVIKRGRPKKYVERAVAIQTCTDENIRNYYVTLNEEWLQEAWKIIDDDLASFSYWPSVKSEVYIHFLDRSRRFSIYGKQAAIMSCYARAAYITLKKTISPRMPVRKLLQTDESLRNLPRQYAIDQS